MRLSLKNKVLRLIASAKDYIDLKSDTDKENTISSIEHSVPLRGANFWYLVCSALLASIGLDVNSPAIIIGAMLISPLMSPILGIGLSLGIHNKETIFISLREFILAVGISLFTSTVYFLVSPLGTATSEILSRTKPTILDVGVAFFGGIAGIVAGSRSKMANAIPGVAIATALMPPICSAGYGFAQWNLSIFFGALYLFFINAVFISLSVYIIVRFLKFPYKDYPDQATKIKMRRVILSIVTLITIPSIIIFYGIIMQARTNQKINSFINREIASDKVNIITWNLVNKGDTSIVKVLVAGEPFSDNKIDSLKKIMPSYRLSDMNLSITQVGLLDKNSKQQSQDMLIELAELNEKVGHNTGLIDSISLQLNYYKEDSLKFSSTVAGIKELFPEIESISYSRSYSNSLTDSSKTISYPLVIINWKNNPRLSVKRDYITRLRGYYKNILGKDSVIIGEAR